MKTRLLFLLPALFMSAGAWARVYEVDLLGLSAHLDRNASYSGAPRALDRYGQFVFNPGIGVGVDFRESVLTSGFSPTTRIGLFQDCDDRTVFYGGGGVRYTHVMAGRWLIGGGFSLLIANGENWTTARRTFVIIPYPNLEIGTVIADRYAARMSIAFAPGGSAISALSSTSLLFINFSFAWGPEKAPDFGEAK